MKTVAEICEEFKVKTYQYTGLDIRTPARWKPGQCHAWIDGQRKARFAPTDTEDAAILVAYAQWLEEQYNDQA